MCRLRERGGSVPSTGCVTPPATNGAMVSSALHVIVASWDRTLSSDVRTERALRLLRPILVSGVLTILGIAFIVVTISITDTWWSLVCGLSVTVVNAGIAIVRGQWRKDPQPGSCQVK